MACEDCIFFLTCSCNPEEKSENFNGILCDEFIEISDDYFWDELYWKEMSYRFFNEITEECDWQYGEE